MQTKELANLKRRVARWFLAKMGPLDDSESGRVLAWCDRQDGLSRSTVFWRWVAPNNSQDVFICAGPALPCGRPQALTELWRELVWSDPALSDAIAADVPLWAPI